MRIFLSIIFHFMPSSTDILIVLVVCEAFYEQRGIPHDTFRRLSCRKTWISPFSSRSMLHWVSARHQKQRQRTWTRRRSVRSWRNSMRRRHSSSIHSMITLSIMSCDVSKKNAPTRRSCRAAIVIRLLLIALVLQQKVFDSVFIALQT